MIYYDGVLADRLIDMLTSTIRGAHVRPHLWAFFSLVLIPLAKTSDTTTVKWESCGTYIDTSQTGTQVVQWRGDVLKIDCTIYIQSEPSYKSTLCAKAVKYDVKDKRFKLTFLSGTSYNEDTKYFTAFENKDNISYCAEKWSILALQFSTSTRRSDSHVSLKITQTPFKTDESEGSIPRERLTQITYRLMGGIGSAIMVALLASVLIDRRRKSRARGGIIIRRAGDTSDEQRGEEMVALNQPSQQIGLGTSPEARVQNGRLSPTQQLIMPPSYSEIQSDPGRFKQYPDSAPPSYEDIADNVNNTDYTKTQPNTSNT